MQFHSIAGLHAIAAEALGNGASLSGPISVDWDIARRCSRPRGTTLVGRDHVEATNHDPSFYLDMTVPCRKCAECLAARREHWRFRSVNEFRHSPRTWMGTLTFDPAERFKYEAEMHLEQSEVRQLSPDECFALTSRYAGKRVTKFFKRLRKLPGSRFTYLLVTEPHESNDPHFHLLLHEKSEELTKRKLEAEWWHGFSTWRLVRDSNACGYVTKYLTKTHLCRVRASKAYGAN